MTEMPDLTGLDRQRREWIEACAKERDELRATFDLRWKADMRAIERWQAAHDRPLVWPDHADLVVWLAERLDEVRAKADAVRTEQEAIDFLDWCRYSLIGEARRG